MLNLVVDSLINEYYQRQMKFDSMGMSAAFGANCHILLQKALRRSLKQKKVLK